MPTPSDAPIAENVNYVRPEVAATAARRKIVKACLGGSEAIKAAGPAFLPVPNAADTSKENVAHYHNYKERAVFYNVTRRTVDGWNGQVFCRDPISRFPDAMADLWYDIDGHGASIDQQAKLGLGSTMSYGGGGLLIDYPRTDGQLTIKEIRDGFIRPTVHFYQQESIINWRMIKIGATYVPNLIVLREMDSGVHSDGFTMTSEEQCRVLRLVPFQDDYAYTVEVWKRQSDAPKDNIWVRTDNYVMRGSDGKPVNRILFFPIGISQNRLGCDLTPTYDLAILNIAHYRNSADYEESCFMVGQPTPVFSGLTQDWVEEVFKGTVELGSRAAVSLPVGGAAMLLQVNPNTMTMEAMKHKEGQMVALGARIIKDDSVRKTLGESQMDSTDDSSILAAAAKNVSAAYTKALWVCGYLSGIRLSREEFQYSLNTDFPAARLTPNERAQLIGEWQAEAITQSEMRAGLRRGGVATLDDPEYRDEIKKFPPPEDKEKMQQGQGGVKLNQGAGGGNQAGS